MEVTAERRDFLERKAALEVHKTAGVVGIDVAKNKHFAVLLDPVGQTIVPPFSFGNSGAGFDALMDRVKEMERSLLITHWVFGFERWPASITPRRIQRRRITCVFKPLFTSFQLLEERVGGTTVVSG